VGIYLEGVWLWRISGGLLTGDDGVGFTRNGDWSISFI